MPVNYELKDRIATVAMDDGKVNVMSVAMLTELHAALDRAQADKAVLLLTGRDGVFSAGFDLPGLSSSPENAVKMLSLGFGLAERLLAFPAPVVVACNGHALAMGVFLLVCADYSVAADGRYKIGANEVAIGMTMPRCAVELCRQRLAPAHFSRALNTAEIYAPAAAQAAGFLDRVVPAAELHEAARAEAVRMSKLHMPAYQATKERARALTLKAVREAIELDGAEFRALMKKQSGP